MVKQDAAALRLWLADELAYTHAGGRTDNKADFMAGVLKGPARYESFNVSETKVEFYGNTAVWSGYVDVKGVNRPAYRVRTLEVYVERDGRWQMTHHLSTRVNP
jgi:hypothetical protein